MPVLPELFLRIFNHRIPFRKKILSVAFRTFVRVLRGIARQNHPTCLNSKVTALAAVIHNKRRNLISVFHNQAILHHVSNDFLISLSLSALSSGKCMRCTISWIIPVSRRQYSDGISFIKHIKQAVCKTSMIF